MFRARAVVLALALTLPALAVGASAGADAPAVTATGTSVVRHLGDTTPSDFTVTLTAAKALTLQAVTTAGLGQPGQAFALTDAPAIGPVAMGPGGTQAVHLRFDPPAADAGLTVTDTLTAVTSLGNVAIPLTGEYAYAGSRLVGPTTAVDLGAITTGQTATATFTLQNPGDTATSISIGALPAGLVATSSIPTSLDPTSHAFVTVAWTPSAAGTLSGSWVFDSSTAHAEVVVAFTGTATDPVPAPTPAPTTTPPLGGGGGTVGTTPPTVVPTTKAPTVVTLPALGDRKNWRYAGHVKAANKTTVLATGSGSLSYPKAITTLAGTWNLVLGHDGDRVDLKVGTFDVRVQRKGGKATVAVLAGSRVLRKGTVTLGRGATLTVAVTLAKGKAQVAFQKHNFGGAVTAPTKGGLVLAFVGKSTKVSGSGRATLA